MIFVLIIVIGSCNIMVRLLEFNKKKRSSLTHNTPDLPLGGGRSSHISSCTALQRFMLCYRCQCKAKLIDCSTGR